MKSVRGCLSLLLVTAASQEAAWANTTEALSPGIGSADLLGLAVSLVVVIATVVLVGWLYSRSQAMRHGGRGDVIQVLAAQALGSKERIMLVDVGGTQIVVGLTAAQVQTLHVFESPVVDDKLPAASGAFSRKLGKLLKVPAR